MSPSGVDTAGSLSLGQAIVSASMMETSGRQSTGTPMEDNRESFTACGKNNKYTNGANSLTQVHTKKVRHQYAPTIASGDESLSHHNVTNGCHSLQNKVLQEHSPSMLRNECVTTGAKKLKPDTFDGTAEVKSSVSISTVSRSATATVSLQKPSEVACVGGNKYSTPSKTRGVDKWSPTKCGGNAVDTRQRLNAALPRGHYSRVNGRGELTPGKQWSPTISNANDDDVDETDSDEMEELGVSEVSGEDESDLAIDKDADDDQANEDSSHDVYEVPSFRDSPSHVKRNRISASNGDNSHNEYENGILLERDSGVSLDRGDENNQELKLRTAVENDTRQKSQSVDEENEHNGASIIPLTEVTPSEASMSMSMSPSGRSSVVVSSSASATQQQRGKKRKLMTLKGDSSESEDIGDGEEMRHSVKRMQTSFRRKSCQTVIPRPSLLTRLWRWITGGHLAPSKRVSLVRFEQSWGNFTNVIDSNLGASVVFVTDDTLGHGHNMLSSTDPINTQQEPPGVSFGGGLSRGDGRGDVSTLSMGDSSTLGEVSLDGWVTHRRREEGHEWAIISLPGLCYLSGIEINLTHLGDDGVPQLSVEAVDCSELNELVSNFFDTESSPNGDEGEIENLLTTTTTTGCVSEEDTPHHILPSKMPTCRPLPRVIVGPLRNKDVQNFDRYLDSHFDNEGCKWKELVSATTATLYHDTQPTCSSSVPMPTDGDLKNRYFFEIVDDNLLNDCFTHLRVNLYPDGGLSRIRAFGCITKSNLPSPSSSVSADALSVINGGTVLTYGCACNLNGHPIELIKPVASIDSQISQPSSGSKIVSQEHLRGWQTGRNIRRPQYILGESFANHSQNYVIYKLGFPTDISRIDVDCNGFNGSIPFAVNVETLSDYDLMDCELLVQQKKIKCEKYNWKQLAFLSFDGTESENLNPSNRLTHSRPVCTLRSFSPPLYDPTNATHIKLTVIPEGGLTSVRVLGTHADVDTDVDDEPGRD